MTMLRMSFYLCFSTGSAFLLRRTLNVILRCVSVVIFDEFPFFFLDAAANAPRSDGAALPV